MITIKQIEKADAPLIAKLSRESFYDSFAADNTVADMDAFLSTKFTTEQLISETLLPQHSFFIAWEAGDPVGYCKLTDLPDTTPAALLPGTAIELSRFYAVKTAIGRGIGQQMMNFIIDFAVKSRHNAIWLGVWENNERAIRFYQKNGFYKIGEQPFQLGNDLQTDWVMARNLL